MTKHYDIVVVGGGIHGVGVAQAAAAAGYSVCVLEQYQQLATGTSSRSSKLVHGGLRYLESGQLSLVRECMVERRRLLRNASDLVRLIPFYIPVYRSSSRRPWVIRAGLSLYALLGGLGPEVRFRKLARREWQRLDGLNTAGLLAVYRYYDAQTDDKALTQAVMDSAITMGAQLRLEAKVKHIELNANGCMVHYRHRQHSETCAATVTVNAAGPWAEQVASLVTPKQSTPPIELVQGTHIVVPGALQAGVYYVEAHQDHRPVFIIPWKGNTMVGTTERTVTGAPGEFLPAEEEIDYLLETMGRYFPHRTPRKDQIIERFAGTRVLPVNDGEHGSKPRETIFATDNSTHPRIVTILGGKLTAYRATAEKVLKTISPSLSVPERGGNTQSIRLSVARSGVESVT